MAEPLTALATLGTVSNIFQILEFSAKVIKQIHKVASGQEASSDVKRFEELAEQYQKLDGSICEHNKYSKPLTSSEAAIEELAQKSRTQANDLLNLVTDLKVDDSLQSGTRRVLTGAVKVIRTAAQRKTLTQQEKSLQTLNAQLGTALLHHIQQNLRSFNDDILVRIDSLERNNDTIPAILQCRDQILEAVSQKRKQEELATKQILIRLAFIDMKVRHSSIVSAYSCTYRWAFTERSWGFQEWLSNDAGLFWVSGKAGSGKSTLMKFVAHEPETRRLLKQWAGDDHDLFIADFYFWYLGTSELHKSEEGLLRSILHQILTECPYMIPTVCSSDRWAMAELWATQLSATETSKAPGSHFEPWTAEELHRLLDTIASTRPILSGSYTDRTTLQPSQKPVAIAKPRKFVLFIDGLDEYAGNQLRLVRQIKKLAAHPSFKICVSSRPENVFDVALGGLSPTTLRLEDLTKPDILSYVQGNIQEALLEIGDAFSDRSNHATCTSVRSTSGSRQWRDIGSDASKLVEQIVSKACGVFLWVHLVVKSVVDGLMEGDSIAILQRRIDTFPPDLYEYFFQTLTRVDKIYGRQTANILLVAKRLVKYPNSGMGEFADSFLTYWLLKNAEGRLPTDQDAVLQVASRSTMDEMQRETRRFLSASSKDLLQFRRNPCGTRAHDHRFQRVEFLHRTVYEFLCSEYMQALFSNHDSRELDDDRFWLKLAVARLKLTPDLGEQTDSIVKCRKCKDLDCACDYYFQEMAYVEQSLVLLNLGDSRREILLSVEASSSNWVMLPCINEPLHVPAPSIAGMLAYLGLYGPLALMIRQKTMLNVDQDWLLGMLGLSPEACRCSSGINLEAFGGLIDSEWSTKSENRSMLESACEKFIWRASKLQKPLKRTAKEFIVMLLQQSLVKPKWEDRVHQMLETS